MELRVQNFEGDTVIMPFTRNNYTVADIEALPEGKRAELINGEMFMLASPATVHQELLVELSVYIHNQIKKNHGKCRVYAAPFSVYLHNDDKTYLEPDISVICDRAKIDRDGCHGAPDWVIEIASPSTAKRDMVIKLQEYKKAGVREYWIVDPDTQTVTVHALQTGAKPTKYTFSDKIKAGIYEEFEIDFAEITSDLTY